MALAIYSGLIARESFTPTWRGWFYVGIQNGNRNLGRCLSRLRQLFFKLFNSSLHKLHISSKRLIRNSRCTCWTGDYDTWRLAWNGRRPAYAGNRCWVGRFLRLWNQSKLRRLAFAKILLWRLRLGGVVSVDTSPIPGPQAVATGGSSIASNLTTPAENAWTIFPYFQHQTKYRQPRHSNLHWWPSAPTYGVAHGYDIRYAQSRSTL